MRHSRRRRRRRSDRWRDWADPRRSRSRPIDGAHARDPEASSIQRRVPPLDRLHRFFGGSPADVLVEREIGDQALQTRVLLLELAQAPELAHAEVRVALLPDVERRFAHPQLATDIADRGAALRLPQGKGDLLLRELRRFIVVPPGDRGGPPTRSYSRFNLSSISGRTSVTSREASGGDTHRSRAVNPKMGTPRGRSLAGPSVAAGEAVERLARGFGMSRQTCGSGPATPAAEDQRRRTD